MIIAITAQKGGTGKTTTTATMAAVLNAKGYKVLLIDLDQQGSLSYITGAKASDKTIFGVLTLEATAEEAIQHLPFADIITANKKLSGISGLLTETGKEYRLREVLETVKGNYDFIIIDCPPVLDILTTNAMTAADGIIVPAQADILSLKGINALCESFIVTKKYTNHNLKMYGVLLTMHSKRAVIKRDIEDSMREMISNAGSKVYETTIRSAVAMNEAQYSRVSILEYDEKSKVAEDYIKFVDEFLKDLKEV